MEILKEIIKDHTQNVEQTFKMAKSDLLKTYRGAALGWAWAIIKPVVTIFVYWFAIAIGMRRGGDVNGYPYFLWLITGLVPWFYMSEMLTQGTESMKKYSFLITKMNFPVSTIPTFVSISKLIINLILLSVVIIIFCIFGYYPNIYYLQIPVFLLFSFLFFTFWSLFSAPISCISKDFSNLVKSFVFAIFWFSGVVWNADTVKNKALRRLVKLNPVTYLVTGFRDAMINHKWFFDKPKELIAFLVLLLIMGLLALWSYRKLRKEIPDVL
ncbi:MAG: Teichoic acid translocation permease protein TagG [Firmicutes bacterium ADurb.Bin300]|nr:MAG: Teichoic acid translocation permease protein TagG [Firmicutes bacterium ADurb.Bin300]